MNVTKNQIDDLNIELTIAISAEDYAEKEKKRLSAYRKNADFKGFRKGMVPASIVKKLYGDQALYEAINSVIGEQLDKFIKDNNLNILGEPLPSESQKENEWKSGNDFEFKFDLGLSPAIDIELGKDDKLTRHKIEVSPKAVADTKAEMLRQYGSLQEGEAAGEEDYVIADFRQGDKASEGAYVAVSKVEGDAKAKFVGAKSGDTFDVNVNEAFVNETDRSSMLKVSKDELAALDPVWNVTVVNVKTFVPAEENQETYDKIFGEGVVKTAEEFEAKVTERIQNSYNQESDYKLSQDIQAYLVKKADVKLPEAFLKRWLYENNKEKFTMEQVEKDFDAFLKDFRWQLVRESLMKKFDLKIDDKDMLDAAKGFAAYQYAMYGMPNVPEQLLSEAAVELLKDERRHRNLVESVESEKVISAVKEVITISNRKITEEKFRALA
ncbi:MAG: trigger factor [Bacteroidales bacterium]|mgnify:CR=1 FL=1|uniref:trigger factor n=2 Tax=Candidatus Cryptobacteroides sp. TaxID=2952915 RepID=UPI002A74A476|nr:trigger factor [Candidatus Cryptobacteroides sp.]MBS7276780.1 trigger factor [Bacteroidales bacterium]MCI6526812.1 trigger factor [Bacteroidales bacterium]MDD5914770.1 trigger factor [Bacteroidales bacterium]MDD7234479.1 trigger factor [Bacteroidales bacterium]MDD7624169.1 trigger factor [Bacteroidales bacterium]